jgi:hypothetical protein
MKNQLELLADAIDGMASDTNLSGQLSLLDQVAWEVNKYLAPASLSIVEIRTIRHLFYSLIESYICSVEGNSFLRETADRMDRLRNQAIGGTWI